ncbi:helix-turn-helix transcriptional regulator [Streptomyces sp. NPDC046984]|uniref:helix-turn-helix domain-containing protein n=1 Tax=Streptomyces sp. NPDC046984 TaxID=3155138 RepID=UPI0033C85467
MHTEVSSRTDLRQRPPLRAVRVSRGWTLRQVAQRSGINPGHLSKVERGEKQLSIDSLYRLALVLELRELAGLLKPYIPRRNVAVAPEVQSGAAAIGNDEAAGVQPAASVEQSVPTRK